jgi:hypothetical protein
MRPKVDDSLTKYKIFRLVNIEQTNIKHTRCKSIKEQYNQKWFKTHFDIIIHMFINCIIFHDDSAFLYNK